jgi:hypothetical protein
MKTWAELGPLGVAGAAAMTAVGAAQVAAILANRPKLQMYAEGGIVPGSPFRGDNVPIMAKGREMVLTEQDQTKLLDMIRGGGNSTPIQINTVIELDGDVIAEKVFEAGSLGNSFIRARGVVK